MQGKNERCPVPFQSGPLLSTPQTSCQKAFPEQLAKCLPELEGKCQNNVVSTTWKNVSSPKHTPSPLFPVAAILFLSQHRWRRACLVSMMTQQPIFCDADLYLPLLQQWLSSVIWQYSLLHRVRFTRSAILPYHDRVLLYLSDAHRKLAYIRNTDLLLYPFGDTGMQPQQKRKALLYAGIGFVLIGAISMVLTYMLLYWSVEDSPLFLIWAHKTII